MMLRCRKWRSIRTAVRCCNQRPASPVLLEAGEWFCLLQGRGVELHVPVCWGCWQGLWWWIRGIHASALPLE